MVTVALSSCDVQSIANQTFSTNKFNSVTRVGLKRINKCTIYPG